VMRPSLSPSKHDRAKTDIEGNMELPKSASVVGGDNTSDRESGDSEFVSMSPRYVNCYLYLCTGHKNLPSPAPQINSLRRGVARLAPTFP
jgi:hypothetical protein